VGFYALSISSLSLLENHNAFLSQIFSKVTDSTIAWRGVLALPAVVDLQELKTTFATKRIQFFHAFIFALFQVCKPQHLDCIVSYAFLIGEWFSAGFYVFVTFAFPFLPFHPDQTWGISYYHKVNAFLIVGGCLGIFARAVYSGSNDSHFPRAHSVLTSTVQTLVL
jgi:hypothetical protein